MLLISVCRDDCVSRELYVSPHFHPASSLSRRSSFSSENVPLRRLRRRADCVFCRVFHQRKKKNKKKIGNRMAHTFFLARNRKGRPKTNDYFGNLSSSTSYCGRSVIMSWLRARPKAKIERQPRSNFCRI